MKIGIISGTTFSNEGVLGDLNKRIVESIHGPALVYEGEDVVFLPRHRDVAGGYLLPHEINHCANIAALKGAGVEEVIAVASTGSLSEKIPPSSIMIPSDFLALYPLPTSLTKICHHITPEFNARVRQRLLKAAREAKCECFREGVYLQTAGPRLESKAETRMMKLFADIVGMTVASEASIAQEMGMPYGVLCSVDNYANGIVDEKLATAQIRENAVVNSIAIIKIVKQYVAMFAPKTIAVPAN